MAEQSPLHSSTAPGSARAPACTGPRPRGPDLPATKSPVLPEQPARGRRASAALVFALALALRLGWLAAFAPSPLFPPGGGGHDRALYHREAQAVAGGRIVPEKAFAYLPLYPWALGALYAVTGPDPRAAAAAGALLDAATAALLVLLARRLGAGPWTAGLAGALYACYPLAIVYATLTMPTALCTLLVCALGLGLTGRERTVRRAAGLGLLGGITGLGFPAVWPALAGLALWEALRHRRARTGLALVAASLLPLLPVALHNTRAEGRLTLLTTHGGLNLYMGNHPGATGYPLRLFNFRMTARELLEDAHAHAEHAAGRTLSPSESSAWWRAQVRTFWRNEPAQALGLLVKKAALFWSARDMDDLRMVELVRLVERRFTAPAWPAFGVFAIFGLAGLLRVRGGSGPRALVLAGMASLALVFITARYRLPLVPLLAAFGAAWASRAGSDLRARDWPALRGHALAALAALVLACWPHPVRDQRTVDHLNASVLLLNAGRSAEALAQAHAGLARPQPAPELHHAEGSALFKLGRFPEAADAFARAATVQPGYGSPHFNRALSLARAGDPCAARQALETAPHKEPRADALRTELTRLCP